MGNTNANAILTEEESSKQGSNGMSPLGSVSVETTQDQVFLAGEGKHGHEEKESSQLETNGMSLLDSVSVETQDQEFLAGEGKDGDKKIESSKLETKGMIPLDSVSLETVQDQLFISGEDKDLDKEKESSMLETKEMIPWESVSVQTTQEHVLLEGEDKDGDTEKERLKLETNGMSPLDSISVDTRQDQLFLAVEVKDGDGNEEKESLPDGVEETEPHSKDSVDESKVKNFKEEINQSGLESFLMETDEKLQKQTSVAEGFETVSQATEVEGFFVIGTQSVVSNSRETSIEEKLCVIDEMVFESASFFETVGTEENMVNESLDEIVHSEEVAKLDQETGMENRIGREGFPESEPHEIVNLDYRVVHDEEVTDEGKADKAISNSKPCSQESNAIQETGFGVYMEDKDKRESSLRRMSRSLPVSQNSRSIGDSLVQQLVSEVAFPSRNKMGLEKANTTETLLVSCVASNKAQETTESNEEARLEMRAPSFGHDLRIEGRSYELTEKTPLICEDKTEIYEATIDVEEKTVILKRSESVKSRGIMEMSLGSLKKHNEDNLVDNKASSGSMKGIVRKRSKSSLLGTCLCCTTAMN
ncbi:PREDICTED: uncharacterized protein LOC104718965 [Camelina sativa]|uniref:Uncharacterized protein LOC104718965 n=1 Tax=Camelina sativa TaxID=90675 RepID=A0ABM0U344_CAMSA|nr:PREDICTED: uncharacterized protein LOC104718965 [Camelina sativa]